MKKFIVTLLVGLMLIGLGSGYAVMEFTSMELVPYAPSTVSEKYSTFERRYNLKDMADPAGTIYLYNTNFSLKLVEKKDAEEGVILFKVSYPHNIVDFHHNAYDNQISIYMNLQEQTGWQSFQKSFYDLKDRKISYPDITQLNITGEIIVHPNTAKQLEMRRS